MEKPNNDEEALTKEQQIDLINQEYQERIREIEQQIDEYEDLVNELEDEFNNNPIELGINKFFPETDTSVFNPPISG